MCLLSSRSDVLLCIVYAEVEGRFFYKTGIYYQGFLVGIPGI